MTTFANKAVKKMTKDPVCGMEIDEKKAVEKVHYRDQTYYFCSPGCKATFEQDPDKYARAQQGGHRH